MDRKAMRGVRKYNATFALPRAAAEILLKTMPQRLDASATADIR